MPIVGNLVEWLARTCEVLGDFFERLSRFFNGLLPALLSPHQLSSLLTENYRIMYRDYMETGFYAGLDWKMDCYLDPVETRILDQYHITSGKLLVLGCGWGRESIAISRRGVRVVGQDINFSAVRKAQELARAAGVAACFHQADYLELPYAPSSFDFALLSNSMYSAIPGISRRQAWLANLGRLLKPNGLAILSFHPDRLKASRLRRVCAKLNEKMVKLPGANTTYQPGDDLLGKRHFIHWFQDKNEIRKELDGAGVTILKLDWDKGMAVVACPGIPASVQIS